MMSNRAQVLYGRWKQRLSAFKGQPGLLRASQGVDSALRFGLQNFVDGRGWWWDEERVGVRWLGHNSKGWVHSIAALAATDKFNTREEPVAPDQQDLYYLLAHGQRQFSANGKLALYGLHTSDQSGMTAIGSLIRPGLEDDVDASFYHAGMGLMYEVDVGRLGILNLRGDLAILSGLERRLVYSDDEPDEIGIEDQEDEADNTSASQIDDELESLFVVGQKETSIDA